MDLKKKVNITKFVICYYDGGSNIVLVKQHSLEEGKTGGRRCRGRPSYHS